MVVRRIGEHERFKSKVAVAENGCLLWTASTTAGGYGRFTVGTASAGTKRTVMAHRWAYEHFVGRIPEGMTLDHTCHSRDPSCPGGDDCLHRRCVNPEHLEPAVLRVNILRGRGSAASKARQIRCKRGHALEGENVYVRPNGSRACRECERLRRRAYSQTQERKAYNRDLQRQPKRKAYLREYKERHREDNAAYQREYYLKNREKTLARQKERKAADPDAARARAREYTRRYRERQKRAQAET